MNNNYTAHFSRTIGREQEPNGVQSGLYEYQPMDLLIKAINQWRERDRLDVLLLKAICVLSFEHPEHAGDGFTPWDIVESITKLRGRAWSSGNDKEHMADDVRRQWKKLEQLWESKREGVLEGLSDHGVQEVPQIMRLEGGGTGNPTRYKIVWIDGFENVGRGKAIDPQSTLQKEDIRYICEDIEDAGPFARLFTKGYEMVGWKKYLYLITILAPALICYLLLVSLVFGFTVKNILGPAAISSAISFFIISFAAWYTMNPLYDVPIKKITFAPWWMQSFENDRLIEFRISPDDQTKSIKAVRYSANCPICDGKVYAKAGSWVFHGRVVGKCEDNPVEHVFSFDHITRVGKYLR